MLPRPSVRRRLLVAYLVPTSAALALIAVVSYGIARQSLESALGERLMSVAQAVAVTVRPADAGFLRRGDEETRTYTRMKARLAAFRDATGVRRVVLFDREGRALVDAAGEYPIGARIADLARDQLELAAVHEGRAATSAVLFTGTDGHMYKSGYAPLLEDGQVVAGVLVDGSAAFFETLVEFRQSLLALAALGLLAVVAVSLLTSRTLTRPITRLAAAADRIGEGDLSTPLKAEPRADEIGRLSVALERMRQGLEARDRQLQMMLSGIAHEVRNPLGGIELFSGLLAEDLADDPERLSHVGRIQKELRHLARLVEEFLDYARERPLDLRPVDLSEMLVEIALLEATAAEARQVTLHTEGACPPVLADPGLLRRALLNLARNAVQATPAGGQVTLGCRLEGTEVRIRVEDNGPGVPEATRERIFEPFYTTREQGSGLGLALVRKAAEAHGGAVVLMDSEGGGACFELRLPLDRPRTPATTAEQARSPDETAAA